MVIVNYVLIMFLCCSWLSFGTTINLVQESDGNSSRYEKFKRCIMARLAKIACAKDLAEETKLRQEFLVEVKHETTNLIMFFMEAFFKSQAQNVDEETCLMGHMSSLVLKKQCLSKDIEIYNRFVPVFRGKDLQFTAVIERLTNFFLLFFNMNSDSQLSSEEKHKNILKTFFSSKAMATNLSEEEEFTCFLELFCRVLAEYLWQNGQRPAQVVFKEVAPFLEQIKMPARYEKNIVKSKLEFFLGENVVEEKIITNDGSVTWRTSTKGNLVERLAFAIENLRVKKNGQTFAGLDALRHLTKKQFLRLCPPGMNQTNIGDLLEKHPVNMSYFLSYQQHSHEEKVKIWSKSLSQWLLLLPEFEIFIDKDKILFWHKEAQVEKTQDAFLWAQKKYGEINAHIHKTIPKERLTLQQKRIESFVERFFHEEGCDLDTFLILFPNEKELVTKSFHKCQKEMESLTTNSNKNPQKKTKKKSPKKNPSKKTLAPAKKPSKKPENVSVRAEEPTPSKVSEQKAKVIPQKKPVVLKKTKPKKRGKKPKGGGSNSSKPTNIGEPNFHISFEVEPVNKTDELTINQEQPVFEDITKRVVYEEVYATLKERFEELYNNSYKDYLSRSRQSPPRIDAESFSGPMLEKLLTNTIAGRQMPLYFASCPAGVEKHVDNFPESFNEHLLDMRIEEATKKWVLSIEPNKGQVIQKRLERFRMPLALGFTSKASLFDQARLFEPDNFPWDKKITPYYQGQAPLFWGGNIHLLHETQMPLSWNAQVHCPLPHCPS